MKETPTEISVSQVFGVNTKPAALWQNQGN